MLKKLDKALVNGTKKIIKLYQKTFSPDEGRFSSVLKGRVCSHEPHCSAYMVECLERYGFVKGFGRGIDRVLHCKGSDMKKYDPSHYRVVFFSSAPIGVPFLEGLMNDDRFEVVGVVTMPDKPAGRGMEMQENVIKKTALSFGMSETSEESSDSDITCSLDSSLRSEGQTNTIKVRDNINTDMDCFASLAMTADFFVVISYGKILKQEILDLPKFGCINVHGSLLPKYRGASPLQSVFLNNEKESGITIMKMDAGVDTGDILDSLKVKIKFNWTVKELIEAFEQIGPQFLNDTLWNFGKGLIGTVKQDEKGVIMTKKIEKADGFFVLSLDSLDDIYAKYRAFAMRPKIWFIWQEKRVVIEKLVLDEALFEVHKVSPLLENGKLNESVKEIFLKPEGKGVMDWISFKNGYLK